MPRHSASAARDGLARVPAAAHVGAAVAAAVQDVVDLNGAGGALAYGHADLKSINNLMTEGDAQFEAGAYADAYARYESARELASDRAAETEMIINIGVSAAAPLRDLA